MALQQQREPVDMADHSELSSSSEALGVLMKDSFLDYINEILMDDPTSVQQVDDASYQAIYSSFYEILDSGSQGHVMASCTPLKSPQIAELQHETKNDIHHSAPSVNEDAEYTDDGRCMGGWLEQGYGNLKQPTMDEELATKLTELDLSFEDLKLKTAYEDLYVGEPTSLGRSTGATRDVKQNGNEKKPLTVATGNGHKSGKKSTSEIEVFMDVREVLLSCARAVSIGDARRANEILQELHQVHGASANGTGLQRTAYFFSKALLARLRGVGEQQFGALSQNMTSAAILLKASKFGFEVGPYIKLLHYFANQSILKAAEGASRLHVIDFGLLYGMQWPCLINALAERKGGPPLLVITGIEFPQLAGTNQAELLEESGWRLSAYAKTYSVPFQYHALVTKWEDLDAASLHLHEGEVLVVNCMKRLHHLADESADLASTISPRQKLLTFMHSLNPHLLITAVVNASFNSPFFMSRFHEALYYYSNVFDMLDTLWGDTPQRLIMERSFFFRGILNIVACEGAKRVERPETYKQWHARITKAGFEQLPIPPTILSRSRSYVKQHYHKDFLMDDDGQGWMLMGWKGRTRLAISAWMPHRFRRRHPFTMERGVHCKENNLSLVAM